MGGYVNCMYSTYLVVWNLRGVVRTIPVEGRVVFLSGFAGKVYSGAGQGANLL